MRPHFPTGIRVINNQTLRQLTGSDVLTVSQDLRKLRENGLLAQKGKGSATYYLAGPQFPEELPEPGVPVRGHETLPTKHTTLAPDHTTLRAKHATLRATLPEHLLIQLDELGKRPGERIRSVILELCSWKPLSSSELAEIIGRKDNESIRRDHLKPMIDEGQLEYVYPEMERHPQQAYRVVASAE